jgi:hypothetical protein
MPARPIDEVSKLYAETGIDLSDNPEIMTAEHLSPLVHKSVAALANDRYRNMGVPYVKYGKSVRYLRADVARYLIRHRKSDLADA